MLDQQILQPGFTDTRLHCKYLYVAANPVDIKRILVSDRIQQKGLIDSMASLMVATARGSDRGRRSFQPGCNYAFVDLET